MEKGVTEVENAESREERVKVPTSQQNGEATGMKRSRGSEDREENEILNIRGKSEELQYQRIEKRLQMLDLVSSEESDSMETSETSEVIRKEAEMIYNIIITQDAVQERGDSSTGTGEADVRKQ